METRPCTCHPDDNPPIPCAKQYAFYECRKKELVNALRAARRAIGDHHAPNDCYATGPLTGDNFLDLVSCPACMAIPLIEKALGNYDDK